MTVAKSLKTLPTPLILLVALCPVLPVASLFTVPLTKLLYYGPGEFFLTVTSYWVLPLTIAFFAVRRNFVIIPAFYLECCLLLTHTLLNRDLSVPDLQLVRFGLLGTMTLFTLVFLNKDVLYPLLAGSQRAWRAAPRLYTNVPMLLWYHNESTKLPIVVHNCSMTGIGISALKERFRPILEGKNDLGSFVIHVGYGSKNWMLTVQLVRTREELATVYAGMRVLNTEVMHDFMNEVENMLPAQKTLRSLVSHYWVRRGFRHAVLALWAVSMMSLLMIPGCTKENGPPEIREPSKITKVRPLIN